MKKPIKICKNPECRDIMKDYKSSKKEYCNDYCRNHHGYIRRREYNLEFTINKNGLATNYKVLKLHKDSGIYRETLDKYERFGFSTKYLPEIRIFEIDEKPTSCYQLKDIVFSLDASDSIIIYKEKNNRP